MGRSLARLEMQLVISIFLRKLKLELSTPYPRVDTKYLIRRPQMPCLVRFTCAYS
jgi:cytochrome P450